LISEQVSPHNELLDAVHEASVRYVEAERALQSYRLALDHMAVDSDTRLEELRRTACAREQALRDVQTQLLLFNPSR